MGIAHDNSMTYRASAWLPGGQIQTLYPATFIVKPKVAYRRERWDTPDGDFIDVDFVDGQPGKPLLVLFHGLEGSSDSHYARAMMAGIAELGWSGAVPNFRSCSGAINQAPRFYHSGDSAELDWILRRMRTRAQGKLYAAGVSLGANVLLRWLGEFQHQADIVDAACAISAPLDLAQSASTLASGFSKIYTKMFLLSLKTKCVLKLAQFPDLFDSKKLDAADDLHSFDDLITAPLHGYRDANDYWNRASSKHVLNDITVKTLVLNAQNDPFLPSRFLPSSASAAVTLEYPKEGGHAGFPTGCFPGKIDWLTKRVTQFLEVGAT